MAKIKEYIREITVLGKVKLTAFIFEVMSWVFNWLLIIAAAYFIVLIALDYDGKR